jgi:hypothetical protein
LYIGAGLGKVRVGTALDAFGGIITVVVPGLCSCVAVRTTDNYEAFLTNLADSAAKEDLGSVEID